MYFTEGASSEDGAIVGGMEVHFSGSFPALDAKDNSILEAAVGDVEVKGELFDMQPWKAHDMMGSKRDFTKLLR